MTDVPAWSFVVVQSDHRRSGVMPGAGSDADLHAAWKVVFENARAVEPAADVVANHVERPATDWPAVADHLAPTSAFGEVGRVGEAPRAPAPQPALMSDTPPPAYSARDRQAGEPRVSMAAPSVAPAQEPSKCGAGPMPRATATAPIQPPAPALAQTATDSVIVTLQADAVSIVLRDAGLAEPDAVLCAFEAAQHLTGRRSALRLVMLNGRTLYSSQDPQGAGSSGHLALVFAC